MNLEEEEEQIYIIPSESKPIKLKFIDNNNNNNNKLSEHNEITTFFDLIKNL